MTLLKTLKERAEEYAKTTTQIHLVGCTEYVQQASIATLGMGFMAGHAEGRREGIREAIELIKQAGPLVYSATNLSEWIETNLLKEKN